eukprot:115765_1
MFGNKLIQAGIITHVKGQHAFKNTQHLYKFVKDYETNAQPVTRRTSMSLSESKSHSKSRSSRGRGSAAHRQSSLSGTVSLSNIRELLSKQSFIRRKDVYFRVSKYMRQNRLTDARNFLRDVLKFIAKQSTIDWSILQGPTLNNMDLNLITDASREKHLHELVMASRACWMDVTLFECKLTLFYEYYISGGGQGDSNTDGNPQIRDCLHKLESILNALQRSLDTRGTLEIQSCYYRFMVCETRACLAHGIVKLNSYGYAAHAGIALEHCRVAMKLDPFHALAHAMYGYLLDRCLDKYEEARQYLEFAIHLNDYYDSVHMVQDEKEMSKDQKKMKKEGGHHRTATIHVWLATLLVNFEDEFRDIEYQMELKAREELQQKYQKRQQRKRKASSKMDDDEMILTTEDGDDDAMPVLDKDVMQGSISLVKQLSHATHGYQRRSQLISSISPGGRSRGFSSETPAQTPSMLYEKSESEMLANQPSLHGMNMASLSYTYSEMREMGDHGPPGPTLNDDTSLFGKTPGGVDVDTVEDLVAQQRMADTSLTQHLGQRFGSDFMQQMGKIPVQPGEHFKLALKLEPQNSRFHSVYGVFLMQQEKFEVAKTHFEKAIKYDPNNIVSLNNLGWILTSSKFSHYQQARNYFIKAAKLRPNNALIQFNLARLLAHAFGSDDEAARHDAKRYYLAALLNDNNNTHIHFFYGIFLKFIAKDNDSARTHMKKSNELLKKNKANVEF